MSPLRNLSLCLATLLAGCTGDQLKETALAVESLSSNQLSVRGGEQLTLKGDAFTVDTTVELGGARATTHLVSSSQLTLTTPPMSIGHAELIVTNETGETAQLRDGVQVLPMNLKFVEATPAAIPLSETEQITSLASRDFDHDGTLDLIVCGPRVICRLLLNDGRGNFDLQFPDLPFDAGKPTDAGKLDAGKPVDAGNPVDAGRTDGGSTDAGTFDAGVVPGPKVTELLGARLLAADDLDNDGDDDVLLASVDGGVFALSNLGHGEFGPGARVIAPIVGDAGTLPLQPITAFAIADINNDGKLDLVSSGATPQLGPFRVDLNASTSDRLAFAPTAGSAPQPWVVSAIAVADVDGDLSPDLVLATTGADGATLRLFLNRDGVFTEVVGGLPSASGGPWAALSAGDVNGDGSIDLVAVGPGQDRLLINDGKGHFFDATASALPVDGSKGTSLVMVDLDRDHDLDLVIGNDSATIRLYVNDGTGKFLDRTPSLPVRSETTTGVCAVNLDGDGDLDLVFVTGAVPRLNFSVEPRK